MTKHNLSVIVPLFNCEQYIAVCIESIVGELAEGDELIVVDDGSTDQSSSCARSVMGNRKNAFLITKDNGGVSSARNTGIDNSRAEYAMFVDADDYLLPGWRHLVNRALENSAGADVVFMGNYSTSRNGIDSARVIDSVIGLNADLKLQAGPSAWSKLFKLAAVNKGCVRFNERVIHGEDALFSIEMLLNSPTCSIQSGSFYRYRMRESSATHTYSDRFLTSNLVYLDVLTRLLSASSRFDEEHVKACIEYSFVNSIFIHAKHLASLRSVEAIIEAARLFYRNVEYARLLSSVKGSKRSTLLERMNYFLTRHGHLALLACVYRTLLHFKSTEEKWIEI